MSNAPAENIIGPAENAAERSSFEDYLKEHGKLIYTNVGDSMEPFICQGRDLLVIVPQKGRLKKYDIPLYKRDSGQYVLHRVVRVRENDYVICGDNRWGLEKGITDRHIIGVLSAVIRDGKEIPVNSLRCRVYARVWYLLYPVRALVLRAGSFIRHHIRS